MTKKQFCKALKMDYPYVQCVPEHDGFKLYITAKVSDAVYVDNGCCGVASQAAALTVAARLQKRAVSGIARELAALDRWAEQEGTKFVRVMRVIEKRRSRVFALEA
jgi:hypothetical protein